MSTERTAVLRTEGLCKVFRPPAGVRRLLMRSPISEPVFAVDDVSFEVHPGEVFGLLGPNGAGKSTLIKLLTTLLQPSSGRAWVCGHDVVREEQQVRRLIGLATGDERSFYFRLTGRQNLEFFAAMANVPAAQVSEHVDQVLGLMGLVGKADSMFYSYSSGMRQKLSIARALLAEPALLFLDEPTKNVDALAGNDLKRLIRERLSGGAGRSVILATHRMDEAEQLCDRIAIVKSGRIEFCGTVAELRREFGNREECVLQLRDAEWSRLEQLMGKHGLANPVLQRPGDNGVIELHYTTGPGNPELSDVLRDALGTGATVMSVDCRERALEDMFLDVVRGETRAG